jgi:HD-like signal output (HDOD) protein
MNSPQHQHAEEAKDEITRHVVFANVQVREYPITLSVNPASRFGPAIELGWDYNDEIVVPIDEYEDRRHGHRRTMPLLYLFFPTRIDRLKNLNYTDAEIHAAEREKEIIIQQRDQTNYRLTWSRPFDILRNEWRAVKRQAAVRKVVRNQHQTKNKADTD